MNVALPPPHTNMLWCQRFSFYTKLNLRNHVQSTPSEDQNNIGVPLSISNTRENRKKKFSILTFGPPRLLSIRKNFSQPRFVILDTHFLQTGNAQSEGTVARPLLAKKDTFARISSRSNGGTPSITLHGLSRQWAAYR